MESTSFNFTRKVLLTGYWPPTNEMLRHFSTNDELNKGGWKGKNWRGLGFDVHSFFPEFTGGSYPQGVGDFRVDYQSTSRDWARVTEELRPVGIITFSFDARESHVWKLEGFASNRASWVSDEEAPEEPTPNPPDSSVDAWTRRYTSLPTAEIIHACNQLDPPEHREYGPYEFVERRQGPGGYLSEYIAYHGMWYKDDHDHCGSTYRCVAAGHIHLNTGAVWNRDTGNYETDVETARRWMEASLEATLKYIPLQLVNCIGITRIADQCNDRQPPISLRNDVITNPLSSGAHSVRRHLANTIRDCN